MDKFKAILDQNLSNEDSYDSDEKPNWTINERWLMGLTPQTTTVLVATPIS